MTPAEILLIKGIIGMALSLGIVDIVFSWLPDKYTPYKGFILKGLSVLGFKTPKKMYNTGRKYSDKIG